MLFRLLQPMLLPLLQSQLVTEPVSMELMDLLLLLLEPPPIILVKEKLRLMLKLMLESTILWHFPMLLLLWDQLQPHRFMKPPLRFPNQCATVFQSNNARMCQPTCPDAWLEQFVPHTWT